MLLNLRGTQLSPLSFLFATLKTIIIINLSYDMRFYDIQSDPN